MIVRLLTKGCLAGLLCVSILGSVRGATTPPMETLNNLQAAYNAESNASSHDGEFAMKAEAEGYKKVAALFKAAAKSKSVHAANIANLIKKNGAEPQTVVQKVTVKSTSENLEAALKEQTLQDALYSQYMGKAKSEANSDAAKTFKGALAGNSMHTGFYTEALGNLESWKTGDKQFVVCTVCGYTTTKKSMMVCPVCGAFRSKFVRFE